MPTGTVKFFNADRGYGFITNEAGGVLRTLFPDVRIIPRAEVYTSGDVTVEDLRGEGEDPRLTAEALAERLGQPLAGDDDS